MKKKKFLFVGNRRFVLEEMCRGNLQIEKILVIQGSRLEKDFSSGRTRAPFSRVLINSKKELIRHICMSRFDVLISNGCPHLLPIQKLPRATYVNIHPSFLPDLRGADPCIGAILHRRDSGATAHLMDEGIDSGAIIAQVKIPFSDDLDISSLYQLSFAAEKAVFLSALKKNFHPFRSQTWKKNLIYYTRKPQDQEISFRENNRFLLSKIKAFNNRSQGCLFRSGNSVYRVFSARILKNPYMAKFVARYPPRVVAMSYEGGIVFRNNSEIIRFESIYSSTGSMPEVGDKLHRSR